MKKYKIYSYNLGSESARSLAQGLSCLRIKPQGSYKYYPNHTIINWGNSELGSWHRGTTKYLNHPYTVALASNKIKSFVSFKESNVSCPKFFTNKEELIQYTVGLSEFPLVYCRTKISGHSGEGIVLANNVSELVSAPLYTLGIKIKREYRIHVFKDKVICCAKKTHKDGERPNNLIRNLDNGWVFKQEGIEVPENVQEVAIEAIEALGLDFGAVDIIIDKDLNPFVLEVNTACGLKNEKTLSSYVTAFSEYLCI